MPCPVTLKGPLFRVDKNDVKWLRIYMFIVSEVLLKNLLSRKYELSEMSANFPHLPAYIKRKAVFNVRVEAF